MGFFDRLKGKKEGLEGESPGQRKKGAAAVQPEGKYNEACALCGNAGTDKKWMGQYWHKKCFRSARKMGRKMI